MNTHPQLGLHPDADRLAAFVERALTVTEREETLAHLASCERCREILYLVSGDEGLGLVPGVNVAPHSLGAELAAGSTRPSRWGMRWLAVAIPAVAIAVAIVAVQTQEHNAARQEAEAKDSQSTQQLSEATPAAVLQPAVAPQSQAVDKSPDRAMKSFAPAKPAQQAPTASKLVQEPKPMPAVPAPVAIATVDHFRAPISDSGIAAKSNAPMAQPQVVVDQNQMAVSSVEATAAAPAQTASASAMRRTLSAASAAQAPSVAQAPPPAPPVKNRRTSAEVAASADDSLIVTDSSTAPGEVSVRSVNVAEAKKVENKPVKLPNHQMSISVARREKLVVAIDSNGDVFRSTNGGSRWKQVTPQWMGRALSVDLQEKSAEEQRYDFRAMAGAAPEPAKEGFQIRTDDGKVWTSLDGTNWISR